MKITKKNTADFLIIILIFALTGLTTVFVSSIITDLLRLEKWTFIYVVAYIFIVFPAYHVLLLSYAFIFGKFNFFWERLKKIKGIFSSRI